MLVSLMIPFLVVFLQSFYRKSTVFILLSTSLHALVVT